MTRVGFASVAMLLLLGTLSVSEADPVPSAADLAVARASAGAATAEVGDVPRAAVTPLRAAVRLGAALAVTVGLTLGVFGARRVVVRRQPPSGGRVPARWLGRWMPDAADGDRVSVLSRSYVGPRESVGVVGVGAERYLVGITSGTISLLARLPDCPVTTTATPTEETPPAVEVAAAPADGRGDELRTTAIRLRQRLAAAMHARAAAATPAERA